MTIAGSNYCRKDRDSALECTPLHTLLTKPIDGLVDDSLQMLGVECGSLLNDEPQYLTKLVS